MAPATSAPLDYDYVVVGSGAGGGPLAANLARAGFRVALLEAGEDPAVGPNNTENYNYSIPAFHGQATQDERLRWDFYVKHYTDPARQGQDSKYVPQKQGVWYPRAGTLGGCTAHNAMITVYPHNEDWEHIRELTGDPSWSADNMRHYFEKLEDCRYADPAPNRGRHGFGGWLPTSLADPGIALQDEQLIKVVASAAVQTALEDLAESVGGASLLEQVEKLVEAVELHLSLAGSLADRVGKEVRAEIRRVQEDFQVLKKTVSLVQQGRNRLPAPLNQFVRDLFAGPVSNALAFIRQRLPLDEFLSLIVRHFDPNDWRVAESNLQGIFGTPLATNGVRRAGTREYILRTHAEFPFRLTVLTGALVTRVLFEGTKAVGVEYLKGANHYRACPRAAEGEMPSAEQLRVRREVILCGGTFNTPQLLILSGIGPKAELERLGIPPVVEREGVGRNLQDRYEVAVVSEMEMDFPVLRDGDFHTAAGPYFDDWKERGRGVYTTNGVVLSIIRRSKQAETSAPDLYVFGIPGFFKGYYPQYADHLTSKHNCFTWAILKGHTRNSAGTVTLKTKDPRDVPEINFRYFDEGSAGFEKDIEALAEGVDFVGRMMRRTGRAARVTLLPDVDPSDPARLRDFIRREAWGHHACGTCKIGADNDAMAVLDGKFRVRGTQNLRVVDASVFPRIPGFFIVTPIYMISEKASDVIRADAEGR